MRSRLGEVLERMSGVVRSPMNRAAATTERALDAGQLFEDHQQLVETTETALSISSGSGATATQQRQALDAASDQIDRGKNRIRELRGAGQALRERLEQMQIVALNAGLEGARLGQATGAPLLLVADETKAQVKRALAAVEEQSAMLNQLEAAREQLGEQLATARAHSAKLAEELLRTQAAQRDAHRLATGLGERLSRATGADPEVARSLTRVRTHAEGLIAELSALSARGQPAVVEVMRPYLKQLLRLARNLEQEPGGS